MDTRKAAHERVRERVEWRGRKSIKKATEQNIQTKAQNSNRDLCW